jgi:hypothetical protein
LLKRPPVFPVGILDRPLLSTSYITLSLGGRQCLKLGWRSL